jgi:YaiO family outer membrane protein
MKHLAKEKILISSITAVLLTTPWVSPMAETLDLSQPDNVPEAPLLLAGGTIYSPPNHEPSAIKQLPPEQAVATPATPFHKHGYFEFDANYSQLDARFPPDANYGNWSGGTLQGAVQTDPKNIWSGLVNTQREFGDTGTLLSAGNIHYFNDTVFSNLSVSTSTGGFFLPRGRIEGAISKRFLPGNRLVGTLDVGYNDGRVGIQDRWVQLSGQYFLPQRPWNFEAGLRYNNSSPGSVSSQQQYIAATYGTYKKQFLTIRYNWGTEGYQVGVPGVSDGEGSVIVEKFNSHYIGATWRKWIANNNGFTATLEQYSNPFFRRTGISIGVFHDFGA